MPGSRVRLAARSAVLLATIAVAVGGAGAAPVSAGVQYRYPDLIMRRLTDFHYEQSTDRLRFDTIVVNIGDGPFIVEGRRSCTSLSECPSMKAYQRLKDTDGRSHRLPQRGLLKYAVDGHNHWHVHRMETYEIFRTDVPSDEAPRRGAKVGYCFFDNVRHDTSLPGAPSSPRWFESGCGHSGSLRAKVGLSVGWGDLYPWDFGYQWIDISGLAPGDYRVCVTVDLQDRFVETKEGNNMAWQDVRINANDTVTVLSTYGRSACQPKEAESPTLAATQASYPDHSFARARPDALSVHRERQTDPSS